MKSADLREKNVEDLRELRTTLARDVFQNRLKNFTNRLDDTSTMNKTKRDLARVITLLHERDLGITRVAGAKPARAASEPKPAAPAKKKAAAPKAEAKAAAPKAEKTTKKKPSAKANQKGEAK